MAVHEGHRAVGDEDSSLTKRRRGSSRTAPWLAAWMDLKRGLSSWRWPAQWRRLLGDGGVGLIEAGTGTGKSLAYLVPAVPRLTNARQARRRFDEYDPFARAAPHKRHSPRAASFGRAGTFQGGDLERLGQLHLSAAAGAGRRRPDDTVWRRAGTAGAAAAVGRRRLALRLPRRDAVCRRRRRLAAKCTLRATRACAIRVHFTSNVFISGLAAGRRKPISSSPTTISFAPTQPFAGSWVGTRTSSVLAGLRARRF